MEVTERVEWEGRSIACGRSGTGPAVVFCHGTPFSSRVWSRYADALSDRYTVHLWDMPGYGESSKHADHAVDFDVQGKALAALLEHWQLDRPHVIAHDFGGTVALRATLVENVPYASLLLVDVVAVPPTGSPFFRFVQRHPTTLDELPDYVHEAMLRAYLPTASHRGLRSDDLDELVAPWLTGDGKPAFYRQIAQFDDRFLVENVQRLPTLDVPTGVVWATQDPWIPVDIGRRIADLVPGATFTEIDDAGHLVQYDAPVALATVIGNWLGVQGGGRVDL